MHTYTHTRIHAHIHTIPGLVFLQLSRKSQEIITLHVELSSARTTAERASSNLESSSLEKGRLQVEALSLAKLRDSATASGSTQPGLTAPQSVSVSAVKLVKVLSPPVGTSDGNEPGPAATGGKETMAVLSLDKQYVRLSLCSIVTVLSAIMHSPTQWMHFLLPTVLGFAKGYKGKRPQSRRLTASLCFAEQRSWPALCTADGGWVRV
eukprot:1161797-Pelagomonas_calceolata.AAC.5